MKILLINPASLYSIKAPPLGLLYLASYLRSKIGSIDIQILDANISGLTNQAVVTFVKNSSPDLVGFYTITSNSHLAHDLIKAVRPYIRYVVIGGPYATAYSDQLAKDKDIDFIVAGEGEILFYRLVNMLMQLENKTPAEASQQKGDTEVVKVLKNAEDFLPDLDCLPFPAWDLLDINKYFSLLKKTSQSAISFSKYSLPIITSRGCPYNCTYCHNIFGKRFRARSAENIISEIEFLVSEYGIKEVEIWDDVFNLDQKRVYKFCSQLKEKNLGIKFSFSNGIRTDRATPELIDRLVESGAYRINFAVETVTERLQTMTQKNLDLFHAQKIIDYASRKNVIIGGFFMLGLPTETKEEMEATIKYAVSGPFDLASILITTIYPGTALYNNLTDEQKNALLKLEPDKLDYNNVSFNLSEVSSDELIALTKRAYYDFYFNPGRIFRLVKKIRFYDLIYNLFMISMIFFDNKKRLYFEKEKN